VLLFSLLGEGLLAWPIFVELAFYLVLEAADIYLIDEVVL
jgi:hypothetical protein